MYTRRARIEHVRSTKRGYRPVDEQLHRLPGPHGDKLFHLTRRVPVAKIVIDTPEWIERSFDIVDELTAEHGLVSQMVPAVVSIAGPDRDGATWLPRRDY